MNRRIKGIVFGLSALTVAGSVTIPSPLAAQTEGDAQAKSAALQVTNMLEVQTARIEAAAARAFGAAPQDYCYQINFLMSKDGTQIMPLLMIDRQQAGMGMIPVSIAGTPAAAMPPAQRAGLNCGPDGLPKTVAQLESYSQALDQAALAAIAAAARPVQVQVGLQVLPVTPNG